MSLSRTLLNDEELSAALTSLPGWSVENRMLMRTFPFASYASAALFASGVMQVAEVLDHHPEIFITYGKVRIATWTHDAGGLTALDVEFARQAEALGRRSS